MPTEVLKWDKERCVRCHACVAGCPVQALRFEKGDEKDARKK